MPLNDLAKGDQRDLHIKLYERELQILDGLAKRFNASRSAILGKLLTDQNEREKSNGA